MLLECSEASGEGIGRNKVILRLGLVFESHSQLEQCSCQTVSRPPIFHCKCFRIPKNRGVLSGMDWCH